MRPRSANTPLAHNVHTPNAHTPNERTPNAHLHKLHTTLGRAFRALVATIVAFPIALRAQSDSSHSANAATASPRSSISGAFRKLPRRDGVAVWGGNSLGTYTASDNENIHGSMRIVGVQWTHDLFQWHRARFSWVTEVLPLMLVNSSAPAARIPPDFRNIALVTDFKKLATYQPHDSWGFGISPLSAQAEIPHNVKWSTVVQVTSGGAWFSDVVPFGVATQLNFTVSPSVAVQRMISERSRVAFGYTLHHLSNASFGQSNPGMNSHMIFGRVTGILGR